MKTIKLFVFFLLLLFGCYTALMYFFMDENKKFTIEKQVDLPVEKVFQQFNNLQYFTRWNYFFSNSTSQKIDYFLPYEGMGSALSYHDIVQGTSGEMYIKYEKKNTAIRYQLFEKDHSDPTQIEVKFKKISPNKTQIIWKVETPKLPLLFRIKNSWTQDHFADNIDKSIIQLKQILANKVDKEVQLASIKYDSIMVEKIPQQYLLGISVSTSNKKDALSKNIILNYNKVNNYVTMDLAKKQDEFGFTTMTYNINSLKDREISYFIGIPLSPKTLVSDNSFSFKSIPQTHVFTIYYQGSYSGKIGAIQKLLQKAKKEEKDFTAILETFLEPFSDQKEVKLKLSLPLH